MISEQQTPIKSGFHSKTNADEITKGINLNEKIAIVTGGYSGIGLETTRALVNKGAKVIIPAKRTEIATHNLKGIVSNEHIIEMDLGNLNSVQKFTEDFKENGIYSVSDFVRNNINNGLKQYELKKLGTV